jgi:hypothetical protein
VDQLDRAKGLVCGRVNTDTEHLKVRKLSEGGRE